MSLLPSSVDLVKSFHTSGDYPSGIMSTAELGNEISLLQESSEEDLKTKLPYMEKLVKASRLINLWPKTGAKYPFMYHLIAWLITVNNVSFVISFIIQIMNEFRNMDSITALVDLVTVFISGTFRYIYVYFRSSKYVLMVGMLHDNFIDCSFYYDKDKICLGKYYKLANTLIMTYATFTFFWILQICTTPVFHYAFASLDQYLHSNGTDYEHIPYPVAIKVYAPIDYYKQPENVLFYFYQVSGFLLFGYVYIIIDAFWYMAVFLTVGQFAMIKDSLNTIARHLKRNEVEQVELHEQIQIDKVEEGLKKCVKHHQFLREFISLVEDINHPIVLVDSIHAAISIGFILLDMTIALNFGDFNKLMSSVEYLIASVGHMFFYDWLANKLTEEERALAEAAYDIPWYKCPSQKMYLVLLMAQARRPCKLTGGKMYQLSLSFFASMLRAIFSYFTFLLQMRNQKPTLPG